MRLFIEDVQTSCDDVVCNILSNYLDPRDAGYLHRNKSGLCNGDKVTVDDYVLGEIAHKYARDNYGALIASNVGSAGCYFSPVYGIPLSVDLKTGRVNLPKFELTATQLQAKLKRQYYQLESKLSDLFSDIAEEILSELGGERFALESTCRKSIRESSSLNLKKTSAGHYKTVDIPIKESNAKMKEVKVLQGYYGNGWDDLEEVDADDIQGVKELKDDLKAYDENERYPHRIITRKVPNPDYDPSKARKSRDHGVMVTVADDYNGSDKEVYFTDDESIADQLDSMLIKSSWAFRDELRQDGYDFVKKNMKKLEKGEYEFRKRYSYYTYFLPDGSKPKTIISTYIDKRFVK